ncbi:dihydrofolate reductase family protein [Ktedonobacter racemifer]|uniref:Bifunctional deaminase-reductase domain protein n=1 Tax=Ktedonobacter racemifer DSM 44963 TaxID=485913 RepID=D6U2M5_KTERA|nr:dihydrofolate reductase family protein [Ktedonobacter racemifer]EFH80989.1 bifunctional deaminase-reductase domain protein [Ktedonobacter racemifer DSM 44963]
MRKLVVSEWLALDGVFDSNTMDQWFHPFESDERAAYIQEGVLTSDIFLFGRVTYEMLAPIWSQAKNNEMGIVDKMNSMAKYVVSSEPLNIPWENTTRLQGNLLEEVSRLKQEPGQDIRIAGSATLVHSLMPSGLIDEYRFLVHPILMGNGKRFFKEGKGASRLQLIHTETLSKGVVLLCYQPNKPDTPVNTL